MQLIREMTLVKDRVKVLLTKYPHLRDSDSKLIATIWKFDLLKKKLGPTQISAEQFLKLYADSELTNAETIRRVRQKMQEENPSLRGTVDDLRKDQAEQVRNEIVK